MLVLLSVLLAATPFGLRAKAAGMNSDSLRMAGVDPVAVRGQAYLFSGIACGIAGAVLASSIGAWVPNLSAGRGWIALVAVYLGGKKLGGTLAATMLFAVLLSLANQAQAFRALPGELLAAFPYLITAFVVIGGAFIRRIQKRRSAA
jgi:simple sugar transport system permease protein